MFGEYILLLAFGVFALFAGYVFLAIFARIVTGGNTETPYERLQRIYSSRQLARRDQRVELLERMREIPKCNGRLTPEAERLWIQYKALERENEKITHLERLGLVDARGELITHADIDRWESEQR